MVVALGFARLHYRSLYGNRDVLTSVPRLDVGHEFFDEVAVFLELVFGLLVVVSRN